MPLLMASGQPLIASDRAPCPESRAPTATIAFDGVDAVLHVGFEQGRDGQVTLVLDLDLFLMLGNRHVAVPGVELQRGDGLPLGDVEVRSRGVEAADQGA
mgnify:CR=1 FL=1